MDVIWGKALPDFKCSGKEAPMRALFPFLLAPILIANMVPRDPGVVALQALDLRVAHIGHTLATRNLRLCPKRANQTGLILHSLGQYPASSRKMMIDQFALGSAPTVQSVVAGSAAARAGLLEGDQIIAINGTATPKILTKGAKFSVVETTQAMLDAALARGPAQLSIARKGNATARIDPDAGCPSLFQVVPGRKLAASAAGRYVQLNSGIVEATQDDDELAFIVAHEMAHNILEHKMRLDRIGRSNANVRVTEDEADVLGLKLMLGAGFEPDAAARFWAREGHRMDGGIFPEGTHRSPGKRHQFLRDTANSLPR
jgi:beta-barrel assembly-enhancing protease